MLNTDTIVRPVYYRIIERRGKIWAFKEGELFIKKRCGLLARFLRAANGFDVKNYSIIKINFIQ